MQASTPPPAVRPPVLLGCAAAVLALVVLVAAAIFFLVFIDSGADNGTVLLDPAAAYGPGTVTYVTRHNLYVIRTADGSLFALSDLDAANRAAPTRCRVAQLLAGDPVLTQLIQQYASRQSPQAAGSTVLLRESCNRATYDITGLRLDSDGPNLERFATGTDAQGRLTVDVTKRTCTQRSGAEPFAPIVCPK